MFSPQSTTTKGAPGVLVRCPACGGRDLWFGAAQKKQLCSACGAAVKNPTLEKVSTK